MREVQLLHKLQIIDLNGEGAFFFLGGDDAEANHIFETGVFEFIACRISDAVLFEVFEIKNRLFPCIGFGRGEVAFEVGLCPVLFVFESKSEFLIGGFETDFNPFVGRQIVLTKCGLHGSETAEVGQGNIPAEHHRVLRVFQFGSGHAAHHVVGDHSPVVDLIFAAPKIEFRIIRRRIHHSHTKEEKNY